MRWASLRHMVSRWPASLWVLIIGGLALAIPTMAQIARVSWSTEQGGHGPLVLATGSWLVAREWRGAEQYRSRGSALATTALMTLFLLSYLLARITGIIEIEGFAMYGAFLTGIYCFYGRRFVGHLWFPLLYLALIFPPPDQAVAAVTQPIKIAISSWAVDLLHLLGYPVGSSGVTIQIAQYELLVAAACAGLNSIISLGAICLFYIYIRHHANYRYAALLLLTIIPVAVFANFVRVLLLILVTYYFGDAAAQGFIHDFAGLIMFAISILTIFAIDALAAPLRGYLDGNRTA